jgi:acetyl esterase/lipase
MIRNIVGVVTFALLIFSSCKKTDSGTGDANTAQNIPNVAYGTDAAQKMDVYLPANHSSSTTKVIIMIHGGGWTTGDKADFAAFIDTLKRRLPDYALFNINYRLSTGTANLFPTQENDVKAAVQFIYDKATDYRISNKYVFVGASAGAHLAMLQGYKYSSPVKAKAIVSFFGPSDMTEMYNNPVGGNPLLSLLVAQAMGATPATNAALYASSSPVTFISGASMPTILLHGGTDPLVNASHSVAVKNKLTAAGVVNQYIFYPTGGHGDWDAATYANAFNNIQAFLTANVQ